MLRANGRVGAALWAFCFSAMPLLALAEGQPKVAVLDFGARSGFSQATADALAEVMANTLPGFGTHRVIAKSDIEAILGLETMRDRLGCEETTCMTELGGALGADFILGGNITQIGDAVLVNLRLVDVNRGEAEWVSRTVTGGEGALLAALPEAMGLGRSPGRKQRSGNRALASSSSSSQAVALARYWTWWPQYRATYSFTSGALWSSHTMKRLRSSNHGGSGTGRDAIGSVAHTASGPSAGPSKLALRSATTSSTSSSIQPRYASSPRCASAGSLSNDSSRSSR